LTCRIAKWPMSEKRRFLLLVVVMAVVALAATLANGYLGMVEGFILGALLVGAIALMVRWSKEDPYALIGQVDDGGAKAASSDRGDPEEDEEDEEEDSALEPWRRSIGKEILIGIAALAVTLIAADALLDGVVGVGERLGWSAVVLGLVTGVGTSLPELAAGIAGARHRHPDLVIGNVVGSNVFNSLGVASLAAIIGPGSVAGITTALIFIMVVAAFVAGAFAFTGRRISRIEGGVLLAAFVLYVIFAFS
jgi:cation:H+ antiporter